MTTAAGDGKTREPRGNGRIYGATVGRVFLTEVELLDNASTYVAAAVAADVVALSRDDSAYEILNQNGLH